MMVTTKQLQQLAGMHFRDGLIQADDLNKAVMWPEFHPPVTADKAALNAAFGIGETK